MECEFRSLCTLQDCDNCVGTFKESSLSENSSEDWEVSSPQLSAPVESIVGCF